MIKRSVELIQQQALDQVSGLKVLQNVALQTHEIFIYVREITAFGIPASTALGFIRHMDFPRHKLKHDQLYTADVVYNETYIDNSSGMRVTYFKPYEETIQEVDDKCVEVR
jgi:hypothetical protein